MKCMNVNICLRFENYSIRRYGGWNEYAAETWNILGKTIYNFIGLERIRGHYVITMRPKENIKPWVIYLVYAVEAFKETNIFFSFSFNRKMF